MYAALSIHRMTLGKIDFVRGIQRSSAAYARDTDGRARAYFAQMTTSLSSQCETRPFAPNL